MENTTVSQTKETGYMPPIELSFNESVKLRQILSTELDRVAKNDNRFDVQAVRALWDKISANSLCASDTNRDGDCHHCHRHGGCVLRKSL